jgi:hypothetical protein
MTSKNVKQNPFNITCSLERKTPFAMATLDDKLLGCKTQNYASSSESEEETEEGEQKPDEGASQDFRLSPGPKVVKFITKFD